MINFLPRLGRLGLLCLLLCGGLPLLAQQAPTLTCTSDTTVAIGADGSVMLDFEDLIISATDDGMVVDTTSIAAATFDCDDIALGAQTFTAAVTITDDEDLTASCDVNVTVIDTLGPTLLGTNLLVIPVPTTTLSNACPGSTAFTDLALNQPLTVAELLAICAEAFNDEFPADFFTSLFSDNCTADEDLIVLLEGVESVILENGNDSITLTGVLIDESGNRSIVDTATVILIDDIDPEVTVMNQAVVLGDDGNGVTFDTDDLITVTDNCGEMLTIVADRSLSFDSDDIGTNTVTFTVTDASGNVTTVTVDVIVGFEQPNLACISEINLTLNEDCRALLIPEMVLTGNTGLLSSFNFDIVVMDDNPANGPIIDGCGRFNYTVRPSSNGDEPTIGFTGAFAPENFALEAFYLDGSPIGQSGDIGTAEFTDPETITLTTLADDSGTRLVSRAVVEVSETGTVSLDYNYNGANAGFDNAIVLTDFEGDLVEVVLNTDMPESGSISFDVEPGYTIFIAIVDDGFMPIASNTPSILVVDNFVFLPPTSPLNLDFETCWGVVNAEDKTPPAVVTTPDDVDLLCVDFENDANNVTTLPASVDRCYRVNSFDGSTVSGTKSPALRARLLAGRPSSAGALVPTFTDGCTNQIEVCVNDVVTFDSTDPDCNDIVITRTFTATEVVNCPAAGGEGNPSVTASYDLNFTRPSLDDLDADNIDEVVEYELCGTQNPTRADYPAPRPGDFPFLRVGTRTFPLMDGDATCNIGVTFSDGAPIQTCPFTYKFVRTYTVIDWCDPSDIRTFTQVVKVGDTTAPTFTGPTAPVRNGDLIFGTNAGNICAAFLRLDGVTAIDNCSGTDVTISASVFPGADLSVTPIGSFNVVPGGTPELSSAIPAGRHLLRYVTTDACGNSRTDDFTFVVEDQTPPVAICEDGLNISITGSNQGGFVVLTPDNLDAGSYDDCSGITRSIARVGDNNLPLAGQNYGPTIRLICEDLGVVRVGLRVEDAIGNVNLCWLDVLVEDKLAPTCVAPASTTINCDVYNETLPADIMDASDETLDGLFGSAVGVDNCGTTIAQTIEGVVNSCGVGQLIRTFTSTDGAGSTNTNNCLQVIDVIGIHNYRLTFPVDVSGRCEVIPGYAGVVAEELACDLITTTLDVDTLRTQNAGDECFKLRIEYDVINWCEYNSLGEPYVISRDADGALNRSREVRDLEEDVLYVNVIPRNTATTDDDFAFISLNADRTFNPGGAQKDQDLGDNGNNDDDDDDTYGTNVYDSRGFFRYTQFIKIYDEVAPEITFDAYDDCFVGNDASCKTTVELEFVASDECSDATVVVDLDPAYNAATGFVPGSVPGLEVRVNEGDNGEFTVIATNVPAGQHAIRVRASDGCGNFDTQIIEFCVVADRTPTPICIQTLTVVLADDGMGGGTAAIWASDFIASPINDCENGLVSKYSLYRATEATGNPAFVPVVGFDGVQDIDCDDFANGTIRVRLYAFDDLGSTPNFCEVVVEVQDNAGHCGGSDGDLSGLIATDENEALEGVTVNLTGGMDAQTLTAADGTFRFTNLVPGGDYTVQPTYDVAPNLRELKTSDLSYIIGNILGTQTFDSPYDYIAADVNRDMEMNIFDVVYESQLILGLIDRFEAGSWVFVDARATIDVANPYGEAFPEVYNVNDLLGTVNGVSFVAIELGNPFTEAGRSVGYLNVEDVRFEAGQTRAIVLDGSELAGFQGTIELSAGLELISADYIGEGGLNLNRAGEGMIAIALRDAATLTLEVRATAAGQLSELIALTDAMTIREGVAMNGSSNELALAFAPSVAPATAQNALFQNTPNPVADVTTIRFELAEAGAATLTVRDVAGKLILNRELDAVAGANRVELTNIDASGVLTYTLTSGDFTASRKMVVVR